ncbi:MAG TPA: hypothetical protein VF316_19005 [Polyangiaceae bacterium]
MRARSIVMAGFLVAACGGGKEVVAPQNPTATPSATAETTAAQGPRIVQVACGDFHTCVRMADKTVQCWGRGRGGELGDGKNEDRPTPGAVPDVKNVEELALGANFSCVRLTDKTVQCWGSGRLLGGGKLAEKLPPTVVPGVKDIVELRAGGYMICGRQSTGAVTCWGLDGKRGAEPKNAAQVAVAAAHGCARLTDDSVRCWGDGVWGAERGTSFAKPPLAGVKYVTTGDPFACAVLASGTVSCWGRNDQSELGTTPDSEDHVKPIAVAGLANVTVLAAAESHACALTAGGDVLCWGDNTDGETGRGTQTTGESVGPVPGLSKVLELAVGADHVCARREADVWCWGANKSGQLGDGTKDTRFSPTKVRF